MAHAQGQQHPISLYLKIWGLLFVLSTLSYLVDFFHFHGYLRWALIITVHVAEGRFDRLHLHAHGLGTVGPGLRDIGATLVFAGACRTDGHRGGLCFPQSGSFSFGHISGHQSSAT